MQRRLLVVGGSYAASELASAARDNGYDGPIFIVSEENELPYHRPPLSKTFLKDERATALPLKAAAFYESNRIEVKLGARVSHIDLAKKSAALDNGTSIAFDTLALTVGARARKLALPGSDLGNVFYLRSASDARSLKTASKSATNVVIIGAGFIGLEAASALATSQRQVTVVEAADRILGRVVAPELSEFFSSAHIRHGVKLSASSAVESLTGENGTVRSVQLKDGTSIEADIVIVGVGSVPNSELARQLGLHGDNAIAVDAQSRTGCPYIFAAGDCTLFHSPFNSTGARLESVQNAIDQSRIAGAVIAGVDKSYQSLPWFWSDQYDLKLQIAGLPFGATERIVRAGTQSEISVFHFRNDVCICVESVNRPREHMSARRLLPKQNVTKAGLRAVNFDISALMRLP